MRFSVSSATCFIVVHALRSEPDASLTASRTPPMASAKSAIASSSALRRRFDRPFVRLAVQRHRIRDIEGDDLRDDHVHSTSLPGESQYLRASALSAARSTKFPALLRMRASNPIAASCSTVFRHNSTYRPSRFPLNRASKCDVSSFRIKSCAVSTISATCGTFLVPARICSIASARLGAITGQVSFKISCARPSMLKSERRASNPARNFGIAITVIARGGHSARWCTIMVVLALNLR